MTSMNGKDIQAEPMKLGSPVGDHAAKANHSSEQANAPARPGNRFLGSLRDALLAASRNDASNDTTNENFHEHAAQDVLPPDLPARQPAPARQANGEVPPQPSYATVIEHPRPAPIASAQKAAPYAGPSDLPSPEQLTAEIDRARAQQPRRQSNPGAPAVHPDQARTALMRGRQPLPRGDFRADPVVGWLVVVGGLGLGAFRPIYEGNNAIGRARTQRIPIDFGDDAISSEEQAFIRYDGSDRTFLLVPNMSKTNVVSVNNKKPTGAVSLSAMDVITMGRTQLAFIPFCGPDFDWSEI